MIRLFLLILLLIPILAQGATYNIGSDVTDDYASWAALQGVSPEVAGDVVSFRRGETFAGGIIVPNSGTAGNVILYTSHGTGYLPIIDGDTPTHAQCIFAQDKDYITIRLIKFIGSRLQNIQIQSGENIIIEYTIQTGTDRDTHGIYINCTTDQDCANNIVRYNYAYDLGDDCYWSKYGPSGSPPLWYGNVCVNTGDDCFDGGIGYSRWYNNTCYVTESMGIDVDWGPSCLECANLCVTTFINNICVVDMTAYDQCDNGEGCFLYMPGKTDATTMTINNNIYHSLSGDGENRFYNGSGNDTQFNFTVWQGVNGSPDANSLISNPKLLSQYNYVTDINSPALNQGQDVCDTIDGYLEVGSTWTDDNVTVFRPCPSDAGNEWNIGAYGTRGACPVNIKY